MNSDIKLEVPSDWFKIEFNKVKGEEKECVGFLWFDEDEQRMKFRGKANASAGILFDTFKDTFDHYLRRKGITK